MRDEGGCLEYSRRNSRADPRTQWWSREPAREVRQSRRARRKYTRGLTGCWRYVTPTEGANRRMAPRLAAADQFGDRYVLEFEIEGPQGRGIVRSTWIVRRGERAPRLTSCVVK